MRALLGPFRRTSRRARQRDRPKPLAIPRLQRTPIPQSSPLKIGNIVERAAVRLIGAILLEQSDEWATQRARYMTLETIGAISDTAPVSLPALAS
jgi:hypothetical protein